MVFEIKSGSYLKAKLSFKEEIAPKEYPAVKKRLEVSSTHLNQTPLGNYLMDVEKLEYSCDYAKDWSDKNRNLIIKSNKRRLSLEVNVSSDKGLEREELLNISKLYQFVSTGEYPQDKNP